MRSVTTGPPLEDADEQKVLGPGSPTRSARRAPLQPGVDLVLGRARRRRRHPWFERPLQTPRYADPAIVGRPAGHGAGRWGEGGEGLPGRTERRPLFTIADRRPEPGGRDMERPVGSRLRRRRSDAHAGRDVPAHGPRRLLGLRSHRRPRFGDAALARSHLTSPIGTHYPTTSSRVYRRRYAGVLRFSGDFGKPPDERHWGGASGNRTATWGQGLTPAAGGRKTTEPSGPAERVTATAPGSQTDPWPRHEVTSASSAATCAAVRAPAGTPASTA